MQPFLRVVMVHTRFPENVGMVARACANMGASEIVLVQPELWHIEKARPLATAKGQTLLEGVRVVSTLSEALQGSTVVLGTTARTGGWRREWLSPEKAAQEVAIALADAAPVALVFGPEDRGLDNDDIELCHRLVNIPTMPGGSSLNVAQAVLLILYECHKARVSMAHPDNAGAQAGQDDEQKLSKSRRMNSEERERLTAALKDTLLQLDYLHGDNPDYFLMPFRRFLGRVPLRRHEYDTLMGLCRQVRYKLGKVGQLSS